MAVVPFSATMPVDGRTGASSYSGQARSDVGSEPTPRRVQSPAFTEDHPMVNTRILRPHSITPAGFSWFRDTPLEPRSKGSPVFFKAFQEKDGGDYIVTTNLKHRGIICFCYEPIPQWWTHFVITAVRKGITPSAGVAIVQPVAGTLQDLFQDATTTDEKTGT